MATLQQIYVNLISGVFVGSFSLGLFGLAVRYGYNNEIAPRSWSRPEAILKNTLKAPYAFSWMCWSLRLSYPDLTLGIPGTGTRKDGWAGPTLKVNLDGIIMLKYHVMLLKIALLATVLCIVVILPINYTAQCDIAVLGSGTCATLSNLTDFERTTIANIPPLQYNGTNASLAKQDENWYASLSPRYTTISVIALIIYWYICHLTWTEWIENLALRRIYYLEQDHYGERREELNEIADLDVPEDANQKTRYPWLPHPELRETVPNVSLYSCLYQLPHQITTVDLPDCASDLDRQLAATQDFFDKCIPNQEGFSSSVVAITILPEPAHVAKAWKKWYACGKQLRKLRYIRYHMQLHFERQQAEHEEEWVEFDHGTQKKADGSNANPENEGVPSTAVDPLLTHLSEEVIGGSGDLELGKDTVDSRTTGDEAQPVVDEKEQSSKDLPPQESQHNIASFFHSLIGHTVSRSEKRKCPQEEKTEEGIDEVEESVEDQGSESQEVLEGITASPYESPALSTRGFFRYSTFNSTEVAMKIGLEEAAMTKNLVSNIGIEQLSVFAREYAQSSSNACPFGFAGEKIRFATLEHLKKLEQEALEKLEAANAELIDARDSVNRLTSGIPTERTDKNAYDPALAKKNDDPNVAEIENHANSRVSGRASLRQRAVSSSIDKWHRAQAVVGTMQQEHRIKFGKSTFCGGFIEKCCRNDWNEVQRTATTAIEQVKPEDLKKVVNILQHPTYAVVTFSSRQAAIAARQCLADGEGLDPWIEIHELPVAPLADAPPWNIMFCRGCCRPVTLTISEREKKARRFAGVTLLLLFCFFYTIPLSLVSQLLNPKNVAQAFPDVEALQDPDSFFFRMLSGISSGLLYTLFFSFCPQLFKAIANFEGNVSSKKSAEDKALVYFWFFMMLTAFTGTALAQMLAAVLFQSENLGNELKQVLFSVANSIPTQQAPVWINWLVVKFTYTLPFMYMFQANTFGFSIIHWGWCGRLMRGGGAGGPPPYRIYVDSGTALMCIVAIGPSCPIIAPMALAYCATMLIMLRWLLIFVYRPWYDGGGNKWPALHEIIISSTIYGQVLLGVLMFLRNAYLAGALPIFAIIPTYLFGANCKNKFLHPYNESGLLQTSPLDGWDTTTPRSMVDREEFRKWLVDSHKASYVPICLAGSESPLTIEPAVVIVTEGDMSRPVLQKTKRSELFAGRIATRARSGV